MLQTIHDLPIILRPREKLQKYGAEKLSDAELLAIILRTGRKGENVIKLSEKIFGKFTKDQFQNVKFAELEKINGLGKVKSTEILATLELGRRFFQNKKTNIYLSPEDIFNTLREYTFTKKEHFIALFLDSRNQEIKREIVSIGTLTSSLVHPREVFEAAVKNNAASVILVHNHPSNNPNPSEADIEITKRLIKAGTILGIEVLDHLIITKDKFWSFKENKLI